jgi:hypothetical protein
MRYFEFIQPTYSDRDRGMAKTLKIMGYDLRTLREQTPNKTGRVLVEAKAVDSFKEFMSLHLNNPNDLIVNQQYNVLCIMFNAPKQEIGIVEYKKMTYVGFDSNEYVFKDHTGEKYLPKLEDYGHGIFTTILFENPQSAGYFDTLLTAKYGEYTFERHIGK